MQKTKVTIVKRGETSRDSGYHILVNGIYRVWQAKLEQCQDWQRRQYPDADVEYKPQPGAIGNWLIKYEHEEQHRVCVMGTWSKADRVAQNMNKFEVAYTITEAPRPDRTEEKAAALAEAIKYGCSTQGMR